MSFKVETREKQCIEVEWSVVIPRRGQSAVSPSVNFDGRLWTFQFQTGSCPSTYAELWIMRIMTDSKKVEPPKFLLTLHVRGKDSLNVYMTNQVISSNDTTQLFYNSVLQFFTAYPEAECLGNTMTFMFKFCDEVRDYKHFEYSGKEHKSIQTPLYMTDSFSFAKLSQDLCKLMEDGSNPDVQIRCGDCTIPAHRLILGARSEVFRAMLQSDMREGREGSVEIVDMEPKVLEIFMRYLYTGNLPDLSIDTALALYKAGDKYQTDALRVSCSEFLLDNITVENACTVLVLADVHKDKDLKDRVVSYVLDKKVPKISADWSKFCEDYPQLAMEVLNRAYMVT